MRGHIATKNGRYYPVISIKDPGSGKWKRKWLSGYRTKREAEKARAEAVVQVNNGWITIHLVVKDDKILLKVRNGVQSCVDSHDIAPVANTGLGIEAVRKLLDSSYRKQYHLDARSIGNVYAVDLIIGRVAA